LGRDQEAQYRAAVRLRNDFEHRFHSLDILHRAYTCQGIYRKNGARATVSVGVRGCTAVTQPVHHRRQTPTPSSRSQERFRLTLLPVVL
jgi:hypothetical protein